MLYNLWRGWLFQGKMNSNLFNLISILFCFSFIIYDLKLWMRRIGNALQKCGKKKANPLGSSICVVVIIAISPLLIIRCSSKERLQIMKILQTFIQMICLALQFTNLSLVYKSDISSIIPHSSYKAPCVLA